MTLSRFLNRHKTLPKPQSEIQVAAIRRCLEYLHRQRDQHGRHEALDSAALQEIEQLLEMRYTPGLARFTDTLRKGKR